MARRKKRGRRGFKIPILSLAILGGQVAAAHAIDSRPLYTLLHFQEFYTGFNPMNKVFSPPLLLAGWGPWFVKGLATKVARSLGAAPKMPFGLPISLT